MDTSQQVHISVCSSMFHFGCILMPPKKLVSLPFAGTFYCEQHLPHIQCSDTDPYAVLDWLRSGAATSSLK